jgi:TatD DNase family protein
MPKLFDIHSHLNLPEFDRDWSEVLTRTLEADCWTITVGADLASSKKAVEIARFRPEGVWATVGFHPTDAADLSEEAWCELAELAKDAKVVAIGECGLEYYERVANDELRMTDEVKEKQKQLFRKHIELALELGKPLMIHCRPSQGSMDAYEDAIEILNKYGEMTRDDLRMTNGFKKTGQNTLRGNFHFFAGGWEVAQKCLALGFTLSFTGVITFSSQYDEVIKTAPAEMILAETDAPFVAPVPYRGARCEPIMVAEVVKRMAELRGRSAEEMAEITVLNGKRLFGILS